MAELLPHAFGPDDLEAVTGGRRCRWCRPRLASWRGRGTVFVHPDMCRRPAGLDGYWERSGRRDAGDETGILEEAPTWDDRGDGGRPGAGPVRPGSWWSTPTADCPGPARASRRPRSVRRGDREREEPPERRVGNVADRDAATDSRMRGGLGGEFAAVDVIRTKRDGGALSDAQIDWVVDAYTRGVVADEQMSALAMAILLRGMTAGGDRPVDRRDDRQRRAARPVRACAGRPPTSTPPAASATRSRCRSPRWSRPAAPPCRSSPAAASATPAARSTSWSRSRAGGPTLTQRRVHRPARATSAR